ncbi:TPA: TDP-N-acetylfucosamine:lipid II N-acetylfucosaminyltransferase [Aeromonas veronii]
MRKKILHLACLDKFIPGFIDILQRNFTDETHTVITFGDISLYHYEQTQTMFNCPRVNSFRSIFKIIKCLHNSDKVILHGLFSPHLVAMLCFMPWLHNKCQWIIWGGDLYYHELAVKNARYRVIEVFRHFLISRLGGFITYIEGDYHKAQQWYNAKGQRYDCIMYKSNIYNGSCLDVSRLTRKYADSNTKISLLVGNSADVTNNHQRIFDKLVKLDVNNHVDKIYCPLSYGDSAYAEQIKQQGEAMFGDKFHALMDFMSLDEYNKILDEVDIAVFAHNRQQAMGNAINLLGRGKTLYMCADTSSYDLFTKLDIKVFSLDNLELKPQEPKISLSNNEKIRNYFSEDNLVKQLKEIFS